MKSSLLLAALGLALSLSPACAMAQADGKVVVDERAGAAVDPAAREFIEKFRATLMSLKDCACTVSQSMDSGKGNTAQSGEFVGVIEHPKEGPAFLKQFRISGKGDDFDSTWAFDGETAYRIDRAAKTFASMKSPEGKAMPLPEVSMVVPTWAFGTDVLANQGAKLAAAKFLPDAEMDGVKCRVIEYRVEMVVPEGPGAERAEDAKADEPMKMVTQQTRHVGAADFIPRKIESKVSYAGPWKETPVGRTFSGTYSKVKVNASPSSDSFVLAAPADFKKIDGEEHDLGIPTTKAPHLKFVAGDNAPEFALKTPDGAEVSLASLKGRVVVLDFWATWCGPCKMAMPGVQKLHEQYQGKPVSVFGVDTFEPGQGKKAAKYMADQKFTYGLLLEGDSLAKKYGISGIPTFVVIGRDGKVLYTGVGFRQGGEEELAKLIDKAL